jgi:adenine phosphoribosyltransferase
MTAPERDLDALLSRLVRDVPDFPEPGVLFKDICPLLADSEGFTAVVAALAAVGRGDDGAVGVDKVAGVEARGFILAAPVALALEVGLVPVRKAGKLPGPTNPESYALEYGEATLEVHEDGIDQGDRVLLVDDVLATGGTAAAACDLVGAVGAEVVGFGAMIELVDLGGRARLHGIPVHALLTF